MAIKGSLKEASLPDVLQLLGVGEEGVQPRREHGLGGVVPGGHELHEETAEVDIGHRLIAE